MATCHGLIVWHLMAQLAWQQYYRISGALQYLARSVAYVSVLSMTFSRK